MKKFIVLLAIVSSVVACNKEIDITIPEIRTQPSKSNAGVLDTVTSIVYAQGTIDNDPIDLSYEWSIKTQEGNEIIPIYKIRIL